MNSHTFHFTIPLVNRVEYLKSVAKMWTLQADKLPEQKLHKRVKCYEQE
jgi:hypothetical protein